MNLKKLTQAVFDGLPSEYRWAVYDITGDCYAYKIKPKQDYGVSQWDVVDRANNAKLVGEWCLDLDEETGHWLHSLIERQDVPTAADIDWSKAPEGATHYMPENDSYRACWYKDGFKQYWLAESAARNAGGWAGMSGLSDGVAAKAIQRPESITDVARSIEAARVAEKFGNRCATCSANICSVIDDCYVQRAKEESERIEEQVEDTLELPYPDGDPRYFETSDAVNNPAHYTTGGIECIDAMQAMLSREEFIGYLRGNIFKYQWRYKHKNGVEDLRKADWYAQRLIRVEGEK